MLGVDISHWGGALRAETVRCWWERGVRRVIHGLQDLPLTESNLGIIRAVEPRLAVEAYHYVYLTSISRDRRLAEAAAFCRRLGLPRLWIDLEDTEAAFARLPREERVRLVRDAVARARALAGPDLRLGIYSAYWWWEAYLGRDTRVAADLPLWVALYDGRRDLRWTPFGGWRVPVMKQYTGTTSLCGHSVDLNYYEEDEMALEESLRALEARQKAAAIFARLAAYALEGVRPPADLTAAGRFLLGG